MIDRLLPAVAAATSRMPLGMRRAYGDLSNRVLDSSTVYRQMRASIAEMGSALIDFSRPPEGPEEERLHAFASAIRPWTADGLELRRIGGGGDGAYVMADDSGARHAISLGVGHDVSWDQAMAARGVAVAMFDPTIADPPDAVTGATFHRIGLGPASAHGGHAGGYGLDLRPFPEIMLIAGCEPTDAILKVDIEGAEWDGLAGADLAGFEQVLIEMHDLHRLCDGASEAAVLDVTQALALSHRAVHVHANNESRFVRFGRLWFPDVIEVSFVRRDRLREAMPAATLAPGLDRPSNPGYPEFELAGLLSASAA